MVSGSRMEGGTQILPARVRKTIQSIKEIVGNHSDADIYVTLRETNMDPNETTQKLLYQGYSFFESRTVIFVCWCFLVNGVCLECGHSEWRSVELMVRGVPGWSNLGVC
ncbi:hypothetical protein CK203_003232 [Vitis vinifera]|uniref:GBF-interacting protein 1 N-terminal domain-containing protein n=2 Tax=Vitis vinifera TaxID=29760 RepID=A0A438K6L1_VITVI|nr:hypothetical protein CK203_003232 [Vitis vinifera]CAN69467.1 hypothetical protein VITISV_042554 [Vitis vinifera]